MKTTTRTRVTKKEIEIDGKIWIRDYAVFAISPGARFRLHTKIDGKHIGHRAPSSRVFVANHKGTKAAFGLIFGTMQVWTEKN